MTAAEFPPGTLTAGTNLSRAGVVTNIHLTDLGIEGTLESLKAGLCPFTHLQELDLDGTRSGASASEVHAAP